MFNANDDVTAKDDVPNNEPVKFVAITEPVTPKLPVMVTLPVNTCLSSIVSPNLVDPLENDVVIYDTEDEIINCCATKFPPTVRLLLIV